MRRGIALCAIVATLTACATDAGGNGAGRRPPFKLSVVVSCADGITTSTDSVLALPDGVHMLARNLDGRTIAVVRDGFRLLSLDRTTRAERFQLGPGRYELRCGKGAAATTSLDVLDPNGWFDDPRIGCSCGCAEFVRVDTWSRDPSAAIRAGLDLRPGDEIEATGYLALSRHPRDREWAWFTISRGGHAIAWIELLRSGRGVLASCLDLAPQHAPPFLVSSLASRG